MSQNESRVENEDGHHDDSEFEASFHSSIQNQLSFGKYVITEYLVTYLLNFYHQKRKLYLLSTIITTRAQTFLQIALAV